MSKMKTCWVTGWLLSRLECRISAREHSTRSGILLHSSQQLWKLREHSTRVRDPSTLFAATLKTQKALYAGQGSFYTLRNNYENSGSTLRGQGILLHSSQQLWKLRHYSTWSGILLHSSQQLWKLREHSTRSGMPGILAATKKTQKVLRGQGSSYTLCSNYENSGSSLRGSGILLHSSQQL